MRLLMKENKKQLVSILIGIFAISLALSYSLSFYYPERMDDIYTALRAIRADVNVKNVSGMTPLHTVASMGHKLTVKVLIARGADINAKDDCGRTPLHVATSGGHKNTVELLCKHGAKE